MSRNIATCPLGFDFDNMQLGCGLFHGLSTINLYFIFTIIYDFMRIRLHIEYIEKSPCLQGHSNWKCVTLF